MPHSFKNGDAFNPRLRGSASVVPVLILIFAILLFSGYWYFTHHHESNGQAGDSSQPALRIYGSNTIGAELAPALVADFLKSRGATDIKTQPTAPEEMKISGKFPGDRNPTVVEIHAHGSGTAFSGLTADKAEERCDIGMSSRRITDKEAAAAVAAGLGDLRAPGTENVLGLDGVAVIVNKSNPVRSLSKEQIAEMFSGTVSDWSALGGNRGPIRVLARDEKSGTWDTFRTLVLQNRALVKGAERIEDSRELSTKVSGDESAIGFVGLPYVLEAKAIGVSERDTQPLIPTRFTIANETYPLTRRLFLYLPARTRAMNRLSAEFVEFAEGKHGQDVVDQVRFVSQNVGVIPSAQFEEGAPTQYTQLTQAKNRLSLNYYFESGKGELDNRGKVDVERVIQFLTEIKYPGEGVVLLGFADNRGPEPVNCKVSQGRAEAVAKEFASQGIHPENIKGMCSAMPVASNDDPAGREKNRRVEIWINR